MSDNAPTHSPDPLQPLRSLGTVSLGLGRGEHSVQIVRDTCSAQSLILSLQSAVTHLPSVPQDPKDEEKQAEWKQKGRINAKKSVKVTLVGGKRYLWCACGYSKNQVSAAGTMMK